MAIFGASKHKFVLNPPLAAGTVIEFEHTHEIRLPEAYRVFITSLADGGVGPSYGLLPLADAYAELSGIFHGHLAVPSPFEPGMTYGNEWWDEFFDEEDNRDPCQGAIAVVHHGCTSYTLLIVSGPARGRLVSIDLNGVPAPYVLEDNDFLCWYERWLDELAAGYDVSRVFEKIPGGEDELLAIAATDPSPERRARSTWSLCALPALTPAGLRALADVITDPIASVRSAALRAARHFRASEAEDQARTALQDTDPAVRSEAMSTLQALQISDLATIARTMLSDPDHDVTFRAIWALRDSGKLAVEDLAPLTSAADPRVRATATHYLQDAVGDGIDTLLTTALGDSQAQVRWTAVQVVVRRNLRHLQPHLTALLKIETDRTVLINLQRALPQLTEGRL
ncbi:HEAT repeat domain-containing protein [Acrocarpospora macrocephala]|uniref:HEAT repeat domain-containing protein n=1 Tax=Acrocarpospora macrocephala TaxID=150177 RepID=UPI0012D31B19|nr:HEAT repeat domain-containing protein [Acrocarpospora macrocephala]